MSTKERNPGGEGKPFKNENNSPRQNQPEAMTKMKSNIKNARGSNKSRIQGISPKD